MTEYIRISSSGRPYFVRSRSFSHHHHHPRPHHRRCSDDCSGKTIEEWNKLVEMERDAVARNEQLAAEKKTLKADFRAVYNDNLRLQERNKELVDALNARRRSDDHIADNFRHRLVELKNENDAKDVTIDKILKERDRLAARVREISKTLTNQDDEIRNLNDTLRNALAKVDDLRHQLRHHNPFHHFRRQYSFT
ncbi:hypothetical protein GGR57DRAFT_425470 [Xylariaceae sp. FL1272]|nr:hypothetical protein GGR57DRAFT_425470 [Xylariaceae sp. FL1272]